MLNLNQLRTFYHVARTLNLSAAAKNLFVTQPAVTKQIKLLEEFCNFELFSRRAGRISLTDEGKKIYTYVSRIFELEHQLEEVISGLQNQKLGTLRIGTTKTYARNFMPIVLPPFQKLFPNILIELDEGSSLEMAKSLLDFRNSLAILGKVEEYPEIVYIPIMEEEVVLIVAPDHKLAQRREINFGELNGESIVMKELGSGTRKLVEQHARNEKVSLNVVAVTSNMDFIKQFVQQKRTISFVVRSAVETELSRRELMRIHIKDKKLLLQVYIAFLRDYDLPPAATAFLDYLLPSVDSNSLPTSINHFATRLSDTDLRKLPYV